jgi:hypothetical protein
LLKRRARPHIHTHTGKLDARGAPHFNSSLLSRDSVKHEMGSGRLHRALDTSEGVFWSKAQGVLRSTLLLSAARVSFLWAPTTCRCESESEKERRERARESERERESICGVNVILYQLRTAEAHFGVLADLVKPFGRSLEITPFDAGTCGPDFGTLPSPGRLHEVRARTKIVFCCLQLSHVFDEF